MNPILILNLYGSVVEASLLTFLQEWAVALGVTWGVTMFLLTGPIASPSGKNDDTTSNSFKGPSIGLAESADWNCNELHRTQKNDLFQQIEIDSV